MRPLSLIDLWYWTEYWRAAGRYASRWRQPWTQLCSTKWMAESFCARTLSRALCCLHAHQLMAVNAVLRACTCCTWLDSCCGSVLSCLISTLPPFHRLGKCVAPWGWAAWMDYPVAHLQRTEYRHVWHLWWCLLYWILWTSAAHIVGSSG